MNRLYFYTRRVVPVIIVFIPLLFISHGIYARAGGAGGGGRSSSGDGDGDNVFDALLDIADLAFENPALGAIAFLVFILLAYLTSKRTKE